MPEVIHCPSCQRKLQVPEALLGQEVQCPTCGSTFSAANAGAGPARSNAPPPLSNYPPNPPPANYPPNQPQPYGNRGYNDPYNSGPAHYFRRDLVPHRGTAVLVMGILSLVLYFFFFCLPGLVLGPIAWIMGNADLQEMRAGRMDPEGEGITQAGRICGIIGLVFSLLSILGCGAYIGLMIIIGAHGGFR